jgi:hypothetical protein
VVDVVLDPGQNRRPKPPSRGAACTGKVCLLGLPLLLAGLLAQAHGVRPGPAPRDWSPESAPTSLQHYGGAARRRYCVAHRRNEARQTIDLFTHTFREGQIKAVI